MTLLDCKVGEIGYVESIELEENVKRRLEILGMTRRSLVEILNKKRSGTMMIRVRGTRLAIGRRFAEGIVVEVTDGEQ